MAVSWPSGTGEAPISTYFHTPQLPVLGPVCPPIPPYAQFLPNHAQLSPNWQVQEARRRAMFGDPEEYRSRQARARALQLGLGSHTYASYACTLALWPCRLEPYS